MPPADFRLLVNNVTLVRRQLTLVKNLSFSLSDGQILGVRGDSGCGKTTLLHTIAGLDKPTTGNIVIPHGLATLVFQEPRLLPWRSAIDNVRLAARGHSDPRHYAEYWLEQVGLSDAMDLFPHRMSGGMQKRVALARALATSPSLLLVDEPLANLNPELARQIQEIFRTVIATSRIPALWVSHNPEELTCVADAILDLHGPDGQWSLSHHADHHEKIGTTSV